MAQDISPAAGGRCRRGGGRGAGGGVHPGVRHPAIERRAARHTTTTITTTAPVPTTTTSEPEPTTTLRSSTTTTTAAAEPAPPFPSGLRGQDIEVVPTSSKVVALTFDAGANSAGLSKILRALADTHVPATFFLTGTWAR